MKQFKFKLEAFRKLRKFKEHLAKIELGKVNRVIVEKEDRIIKINNYLEESYGSQNLNLQKGISGGNLKFFSDFQSGLRSEKDHLENDISNLKKLRALRINELATRKNEHKVISNMKSKHEVDFKKKREKKMNLELEEIFLISKNKRKES